MYRLIPAFMLLAALPTLLAAQTPPSSNQERRGHGYVFGAPGVISEGGAAALHIGGGGERLLYKGFGLGFEIGALAPLRDLGVGESVGIGSIDAQYHFRNASQSGKVVPFVTGGYSAFFFDRVGNGANFGGGVNYWFKERLGLRVEVRDQVPFNTDAYAHYVSFRFGLTFR